MVVYSAKRREYQLVAKSTVPCFLTCVIFTMSVFPLWYAPQIWGHAKKILCPNFKTVSAPMVPELDGATGRKYLAF